MRCCSLLSGYLRKLYTYTQTKKKRQIAQFGQGLCFTWSSEFRFGGRRKDRAEHWFRARVQSSEKGSGLTLVRQVRSLEKGTDQTLSDRFRVQRKEWAEPWFGRFGVGRKDRAEPWFCRFGVRRKEWYRTLVWQVRSWEKRQG